MEEVAVGRVQLDDLELRPDRSPAGGGKCRRHPANSRLVQGEGHRVSLGEGDRAGADRSPAPRPGGLQGAPAFPGRPGAGLATGVGQLDSGHGPHPVEKPGDPRQRLDLPIVP